MNIKCLIDVIKYVYKYENVIILSNDNRYIAKSGEIFFPALFHKNITTGCPIKPVGKEQNYDVGFEYDLSNVVRLNLESIDYLDTFLKSINITKFRNTYRYCRRTIISLVILITMLIAVLNLPNVLNIVPTVLWVVFLYVESFVLFIKIKGKVHFSSDRS